METFILFIILALATISLFLGFAVYAAVGKIKSLERAKRNLMDEKSKLSDQIRIKGIAVDRLTREIKRLEKEKK